MWLWSGSPSTVTFTAETSFPAASTASRMSVGISDCTRALSRARVPEGLRHAADAHARASTAARSCASRGSSSAASYGRGTPPWSDRPRGHRGGSVTAPAKARSVGPRAAAGEHSGCYGIRWLTGASREKGAKGVPQTDDVRVGLLPDLLAISPRGARRPEVALPRAPSPSARPSPAPHHVGFGVRRRRTMERGVVLGDGVGLFCSSSYEAPDRARSAA